jgi:hypothetical protein
MVGRSNIINAKIPYLKFLNGKMENSMGCQNFTIKRAILKKERDMKMGIL